MQVREVTDAMGRIDILINNAGTNLRKPALDFDEAEWDRVLDTNLKGTFFCSHAVARVMIKGGGGKIINISSAAGSRAVPWLTPYSVSKAGIIHLTSALALEWARYGITVNAIAPSYTETPLTREWLSDPERYEMIAKRSPLTSQTSWIVPHEILLLSMLLS
jgi:gluconate 5-dehydrogenase